MLCFTTSVARFSISCVWAHCQVLEAMAPLFDLVQPKAVLWAAFRRRLHDNLHIVMVQTSSDGSEAELASFMQQHCHVNHFRVCQVATHA
jgi:hypothetical protein